jgi:hypothetical protein
MALILNDRVSETTVTTGTGSFTLAGALTDFQSFNSGIGVGNTTYYSCVNPNTGEWEVGIGTLSGTTTLVRTTILDNYLGTTAAVSFTAGTKLIFCTYPASRSVNLDATGVLALYTQGAAAGSGTILPQSIAQFLTNLNNYTQFSLQNLNAGTLASADFVITADNGNDTTNYSDMGVASSGHNDPTHSVVLPNDGYYYINGGNLIIGTQTAAKIIKFIQGGTLIANEVARFAPTTNNLLVGTTVDTTSKIRANGIVESMTGGFRFPDSSVQTSAASAPRAITGGLNIGLQTLPTIVTASLSTANGQFQVTYTTATPHCLEAMQVVKIENASPSSYNGSFAIQYISATQFAVTYATTPGVYAGSATAVAHYPVNSQSFTFADALATTSSVISIAPSASTANSALGGDELEMDGLSVAGSCTTNGTINVYVYSNGPIAGIRNFNYTLS